MSLFTLNIYLNDDFEGGGTGFYMNCIEKCKEDDFNNFGPLTHTVKPK